MMGAKCNEQHPFLLNHRMERPVGERPSIRVPDQVNLPGSEARVICAMMALCLFGVTGVRAQATPPGTTTAPIVDSAPAGPVGPAPAAPVSDAAAEASPTSGIPKAVYIPAHAELVVRLHQPVDSGHVRNGDMLEATLAAPVKASNGRVLPAGTRVGVTVLAVAAAGKFQSQGEMTLQVTQVGPVGVLTDAQTFFGQEGHKDLPDSAPAKGTEAALDGATTLRFHVPAVPKS